MEEVCIPVEELTKRRVGHSSSYWKGLLLGGLVGAGIALLSTPRSGEANRWMLREKGIELKEKALSTAEEARLRAEEMARISAERATDLKQRGQSFIETQKTNLQSTVEGMKEGVRTYKESPAGESGGMSVDLSAPLAPAPESDLSTHTNLNTNDNL